MKPLENAEAKLREQLERKGWKVLHKGWPDFVCVKDDNMMFIEVKSYKGQMLKREQHLILTSLAKLGLNCYKWTPDVGFQRITPVTPFVEPPKNPKRRRLTDEERWNRLSPETQKDIRDKEAKGIVCYY